MKLSENERLILSNAIYSRIFWIEDFLKSPVFSEADSDLKNIYVEYTQEKAVLEGILKKI